MYHLNFLCHHSAQVIGGKISFIINVFYGSRTMVIQIRKQQKMTANKEPVKKLYPEFNRHNLKMFDMFFAVDLIDHGDFEPAQPFTFLNLRTAWFRMNGARTGNGWSDLSIFQLLSIPTSSSLQFYLHRYGSSREA
jgi:hypothetical protein